MGNIYSETGALGQQAFLPFRGAGGYKLSFTLVRKNKASSKTALLTPVSLLYVFQLPSLSCLKHVRASEER